MSEFVHCISFLWLTTNHHKLSQNNTNLLSYSSVGQKSTVDLTRLKSRHWQSCIPSSSFKGESVCLPFPGSGGCLHSLACGPFLCLQSQQHQAESLSAATSLILSSASLSHFMLVLTLSLPDNFPILRSAD